MKNRTKLVVISCLFLSMACSYGQSKTINFNLESTKAKAGGMETTIHSTIIKRGSTIEWKQEAKGNTDATSFQISKTAGHWNHKKSKGKLNYTLAIEGYQGVFVLKSTKGGMIASLTISKEGEMPDQFEFIIDTITYL